MVSLFLPKTLREFPREVVENANMSARFTTEGLDTLLVIMNVLGNLLICFDAEDEASYNVVGDTHLLPSRVERIDNTLLVEGRNLAAYMFRLQRKKLVSEIRVPPHTKVLLSFTAGVVALNGGTADVTIKGRFGEVAGISHTSKINVSLQNGDVSLNELPGDAEIHLLVGSVTLGWTELRGTERLGRH